MLTHDEAVKFLEDDLHLENVNANLASEKYSFLNRIIRAFFGNIAFTNIYMQAVDLSQRGYPLCDKVTPENIDVYETVKEEMYLKKAGLCIVLNGFFEKLLKALGYDAFLTSARVLDSPVPNNHTTILVRNVEDNDLYYVDVGIGFPTFEAISLKNVPQEYKFAFHQMKLDKRGDMYVRSHRVGRKTESSEGKWVDYIEFGVTPKHLNFFRHPSIAIYADPQYSKLTLRKYMLAYFFPEGKGITLTNMTLRVWDESTNEIKKTDFESIEAVAEELPKYFPMLNKDLINKSFIKWKQAVEE